MKTSVYNIFDDVSETKFPGFGKVLCQSASSSLNFINSLYIDLHICERDCVFVNFTCPGNLVGMHSRT